MLEIRKTGTALIKGLAQVQGHATAALSFSYESDQSFLLGTLGELENLVRDFPMK